MAYFHDYGIPFFIDRRKPLNQHPAVGLICSALQTVTSGFSGSDIFAYLKTDLVPIERREVDLLENYCLAFGITGSDWTDGKDWHFAGDDEQFDKGQINRIRQKVSRPLLKLRDRLCPPDNSEKTLSAEQFTQIIFDFIDCLKVRETISGWIDQAGQDGDYAAVDEHRQFYDKLLNVFDELVEVFATRQMNCEDYFAIINSAFSQLTLAFIPPGLDEVLVGSIERSRHPDLKAVFLIGTTQKQFPSPIVYNGILTDDDRGAAEASDFALAAATDRTLAERQYLAYIAFTRPSQFLYVTFPAVDDKGSAIARSQFIESIESLFENLGEEFVADDKIDLDNIYTYRELADLLCRRLGKDAGEDETDDIGRLLDDICVDSELTGLGAGVRSAIDYDNSAKLDETIVAQLSGRQTESSATRLATFAVCPYQYFARYVLDLEERKEFKLRPLEVGDFYHRVLDALLKQLNAEGKDFASLQDDQLLKILRRQIVKIVSENRFIANFARHSAHNNFIIHSAGEVLEDCVLAIAQMVRAGSFRPALSEVSFGRTADSGDTLGQYRISLPNGRELSLNGKIDRLDITETDGEETLIVFDYKKSENKASFNWAGFYHGLDMQLPIYILAVRNAVGAFYMPVEISPPTVTLDKLSKETNKFVYKAKGIFNGEFFQQLDSSNSNKFYNFFVTKKGDQYGHDNISGALRPNDFEKVLKFTEQKIIELARQILSGSIDVRPYRLSGKSPCGYCRYKSVCRFDWQINEYNFLEPLGKTEVLEQIGH
jgi:ATP-dependent helicase/nuclease subunit B